MRDIKFRAWHKGKKIIGEVLGVDILHKEIYFSNGDVDCCGFSDFKYIELMQYTGLKDKNNKEIYEGDILSNGNNEKPYKVIFENGSFRAEFEGDFEEYSFDLIDVVAQHCEIIGNIYENPELIKE
jgi:hypothetical protein|nr:MAG TPA: YopX protein [Caudoviricetes sp.]